MFRFPKLPIATLGLVLVLAASGLHAQSTLNQSISGQVADTSGAAFVGATITVTNQDTGLTRAVKSNSSGFYVIPDLPAGRYRITAEASGFAKQDVEDNPLATGVSITVNLKMQVGDVSEVIKVHADALVLETTSGEVGFTVTGDQASELQLNGRNFPELLALMPGVSTTYTDGFGLFGGYGVNNSGQSINGGRTDTTTWNLDGADNKDNGGGGNNFININPDALGEFRALTSNYSAEYGSSSGAVVNLTIRSGTHQFHGKLYEYWRNDFLNATNFNGAALAKPILRWNNFGGNIGGPILLPFTRFNRNRDKLFFFYSEDLKYLRTASTNTWTVPTAAQKLGDFGTTPIKDPTNGIQFPNNVIPANRINPNLRKLIDIYPAGNQGPTTFSFNALQPTDVHQEVLKVDYNVNDHNQINVHWVHDYYRQLNNITNLVEYYRQIPGVNTSIQWNRVISPTWNNLLQFSYTGNVIIEQNDLVPNALFLKSFTREGFGINLPTIYHASNVIPQIAISNLQTLAVTPLAFNNFNRIFSLKEGLTKIAGNHTLKMGFLLMRSRKNQDNPPAINGQFSFSTARSPTSGNALSDALLGAFQQYTEFPSVRQGWYRFSQFESYIQDDWRVNRRLSVNLGLRWSYMQPQYSALNNTVQFLPAYYNPAQAAVLNPTNGTIISAPNRYNGLVIPGNGFPESSKGRVLQYNDPAVLALFHNLPKGGSYTRWGNFAPRLGLAYSLNEKTVIRSGFGVAYERIQGNFIFSGINNAPFNSSTVVLNGDVENPSNGAAGALAVSAINNSHYLDMKDPRSLTWSFGVQRKLARDMSLSLSYVGSSAANLSFQQDINQLPLGYGKSNYVPGSTTVLANTNYLRPYKGFSNIFEFNAGANYIYHSLQAQLQKRFGRLGSMSTAFTWAKARTDANAYNYQPMDSYNLRADWAASSYNRKFVVVPSWVYPLPWWQGGGTWYKQAFGGWQLNGLAQFQSGLPVNPVDSPDQAGTGSGNQRPVLVGDPYSGPGVGGFQILNKSAFAIPALSTFGNLGAFNVYLPFWINVNSSLVKSFYSPGLGGEKWKWDARFEMYNVANHLVTSATNVGGFTGPTIQNWGQKTGTTPPRAMQVSVRLNF